MGADTVGVCPTQQDSPAGRPPQPRRVPVTIRLLPDTATYVRDLADREAEGNVSLMVRKLLGEALTARARR
jgi:hypothetical protein